MYLGPNPQTTVVAEEIWMQFVANKEESEKEQVKEESRGASRENKLEVRKVRKSLHGAGSSSCQAHLT